MRSQLSFLVRLVIVFSTLGAFATMRVWATPETTDPQKGPVVGHSLKNDTSPPLRTIAAEPAIVGQNPREVRAPAGTDHLAGRPPVDDPVAQLSFGPGAAAIPAPIVTFEGINNRNGVMPPDTNGDVGPNHYVQMVNMSLQIWDKNGRSLYGPVNSNTIWRGFGGPCETRNDGDPVVVYDSLADRWVVSQFTTQAPYGECIAVSQTGDPTGAWHRYWFQLSSSSLYDYPKLGVWPDAYYMGVNRVTTAIAPSAIAFNRAKMLAGQPATYQEFKPSATGTFLPSDFDGKTPPPSGAPNLMAELRGSAINFWRFKVDWTTPSNSTLTGPTSLSVAAFNRLCTTVGSGGCIPQPTGSNLDTIGDRLMHRLAYRNFGTYQALVVSHSVNAVSSGIRAGVRWYEIRVNNGTPSIYQQGTFSPDTENRWMPSIAMDKNGNIAIGYSVSSRSTYPSIRYTARLASDPLGQMTQGEGTIIRGTGAQTGASRWGDYAAMSVDPADDCTFWFTSEYYATTSSRGWQTHVGAFRLPSCNANPTPTPITPTPTPITPTPTPVTRTPTPTPITRTPTPITPTPVTRTPTPITPTPGPGVVFSDDFERETGWVVNPDRNDTATSGQWERGDPEATDYNGPKQLGTTTSGSNDLVTGRLAGTSVGAYDLDGGVTSIRSPSIDLPSDAQLELSLRYYLAHAQNASADDYLRVRVVPGDPTRGAQTVFERLGSAVDVDASWQSATIDLSSYAGQTVYLVIETADAGTASLLEVAVDDVLVSRSTIPDRR